MRLRAAGCFGDSGYRRRSFRILENFRDCVQFVEFWEALNVDSARSKFRSSRKTRRAHFIQRYRVSHARQFGADHLKH